MHEGVMQGRLSELGMQFLTENLHAEGLKAS